MMLSIIIPVYNGEHKIARCLDSVFDQGLLQQDFEVLVFNDGSTDNTEYVVKSYGAKYQQIKLISAKNRGQGACRNAGLDAAAGKYIYFIDADDYLAPNYLSHLLKLISSRNLDLLTFESKVVRREEEIIPSAQPSKLQEKNITVFNGRTYIAEKSYKNEVWWFLVSREYLKNHDFRLIEGHFMEDVFFTTQVVLHADRIAHLPEKVHRYVKSPDSTLGNEEPSHYIKVITDMVHLIIKFKEIINNAALHFPGEKKCLERLKIRRDSLVFFMIIRMLKSQLTFKEIWQFLDQIKETGGYPMRHFISEEYNRTIYKLLTPLLNKKSTLYLLYKLVRSSKKLRSKLW